MRRLLLFIVIGLVLVSPLAAQMPTYCGQLSDDDCALMHDAIESLSTLHSATITQALMRQQGFGSVPDSQLDFALQGVIGGLPSANVMDFRNLSELNADLTLTLNLSGIPEDAGPVWDELPENASVHVRLVDGILYIDADSLTPPLDSPDLHGWLHFDLSPFVPQPTPTSAGPTPTSGAVILDPVATGDNVDRLAETLGQDAMEQFVSVTRTGDVFETKVDFAGLYANPVFQATLRESLLERWQQYGRTGDITDQNLAKLASAMAEIFPQPVTLFAITADPATRTARGLRAWGMFDFTIMVEAGASGNDISGWGNAAFEMSVDFDDFNAVEPVTAPEESQPISLEVLLSIPVMRLAFPSGDM